MVDRLSEIYWELQGAVDPTGLEEFTERAAAGEHGPVTADELRAFLGAVEERLVRRIQGESSSAHNAAAADDLADETRAWIEDLIAKHCP